MKPEKIGIFFKDILAILPGFFLCFLAASSPSYAATQWDVGVSGGSGGIEGFHVSIGEYYRVPEREVIVVRDRGVHEEELPVVFFLARRAHVSPEAVVSLRLRGMNWMDITLHFGLSPEIYYVPVRQGPPYGNAYGHYRKHHKGGWRRNDLRDQDIVNQVNLKFISEHYGYAPDKVMRYRSEGRSFDVIDRDVRHEKQGKATYQDRKEYHKDDPRQKNYREKGNKQGEKGKGKGKKWENN